MVRIRKITGPFSETEYAAIVRLNGQLTGKTVDIQSPPYCGGMLFVAEQQEGIVGMVTVCLYDAPSGRKAWIEDFVVDAAVRQNGVGRMLMDSAVDYARESGAVKVMLTSRPSREAAHSFYDNYGFCMRDTDVFVLSL